MKNRNIIIAIATLVVFAGTVITAAASGDSAAAAGIAFFGI